jgi:hypothetical protein
MWLFKEFNQVTPGLLESGQGYIIDDQSRGIKLNLLHRPRGAARAGGFVRGGTDTERLKHVW